MDLLTPELIKMPGLVFIAGLLFILLNLGFWTVFIWYFWLRNKLPESLVASDDISNSFFKQTASYVATFHLNSRRRFTSGGFRFRGQGTYFLTDKGVHFQFESRPVALMIPADMLNGLTREPNANPPIVKIAWTLIDKDFESYFVIDNNILEDLIEKTKNLISSPMKTISENKPQNETEYNI